MNLMRWVSISVFPVGLVVLACWIVLPRSNEAGNVNANNVIARDPGNSTRPDSKTNPGTPPLTNNLPQRHSGFDVPKTTYRPGEPFDVFVDVPLNDQDKPSPKACMGRLHIVSEKQESVANMAFFNGTCEKQSMQVRLPVNAPLSPGTYRFQLDWMDQKINSDTVIIVR